MDCERSVVFDQAENRLHVQKAILLLLLGGKVGRRIRGMQMAEKVVLAYSGGLDTSIIIPWLKENYDCDVVAMVGDVGPGRRHRSRRRRRRTRPAPARSIVEDMREEFVTGYVFPALRAGAVYEHKYLLGHFAGASGDREASGGSRARARARRGRARLHRQGQRSGPLRADLSGARARAEGDRAVARVGL